MLLLVVNAAALRWGCLGGPPHFSASAVSAKVVHHMGSRSGKAGSLAGCLVAERFHMIDLQSETAEAEKMTFKHRR
jgi:hypothetical protein